MTSLNLKNRKFRNEHDFFLKKKKKNRNYKNLEMLLVIVVLENFWNSGNEGL
jgi:hypothetical protein